MSTSQCSDIREWLASGPAEPPAPDLIDHIAGCELCQGALILALGVERSVRPALDCDEYQQRIPELIDGGAALPRATTLLLLFHLSACAECREVYRLTMTLVAAERVGTLAEPPQAAGRVLMGAGPIRLLRLARTVLNLLLPGGPEVVTRGADDDETVIAEGDTGNGFAISVKVATPRAAEWTISVRLSPAPAGWVTVLLGDALYRAPLLSDGSAQIPGVSAALLGAPDGPPLEIAVELTER